jgi:hypothetical protein
MKVWLTTGMAVGIAVFMIAAVILLMFYYRPTLEWAR